METINPLRKQIGKEIKSEDQLINGREYILAFVLSTPGIYSPPNILKVKYWYDPLNGFFGKRHTCNYSVHLENTKTHERFAYSISPGEFLQNLRNLETHIFELKNNKKGKVTGMKIIDKTTSSEKWNVKDIVETKEGHKGIIQKSAYGTFAIVRLDDKYQGSYDHGFVYKKSDSLTNLRIENLSFFKVDGNRNEIWHEKDYVKNNKNIIGQIIKDDDGDYYIWEVDIDNNGYLRRMSRFYKRLSELKMEYPEFHKIKATLILEDEQ